MVSSIDDVLSFAEVIVIGNNDPSFHDVLEKTKENQVVIDLVRVVDQKTEQGRYEGICW